MRKQVVVQALLNTAWCDGTAALARVILGGTRAEGQRYEEIESVYYRSVYGVPVGNASGSGAGGVSLYGSGFGGYNGFGR